MTPKQVRIRELQKVLERLKEDNDNLKKAFTLLIQTGWTIPDHSAAQTKVERLATVSHLRCSSSQLPLLAQNRPEILDRSNALK